MRRPSGARTYDESGAHKWLRVTNLRVPKGFLISSDNRLLSYSSLCKCTPASYVRVFGRTPSSLSLYQQSSDHSATSFTVAAILSSSLLQPATRILMAPRNAKLLKRMVSHSRGSRSNQYNTYSNRRRGPLIYLILGAASGFAWDTMSRALAKEAVRDQQKHCMTHSFGHPPNAYDMVEERARLKVFRSYMNEAVRHFTLSCRDLSKSLLQSGTWKCARSYSLVRF